MFSDMKAATPFVAAPVKSITLEELVYNRTVQDAEKARIGLMGVAGIALIGVAGWMLLAKRR